MMVEKNLMNPIPYSKVFLSILVKNTLISKKTNNACKADMSLIPSTDGDSP